MFHGSFVVVVERSDGLRNFRRLAEPQEKTVKNSCKLRGNVERKISASDCEQKLYIFIEIYTLINKI